MPDCDRCGRSIDRGGEHHITDPEEVMQPVCNVCHDGFEEWWNRPNK